MTTKKSTVKTKQKKSKDAIAIPLDRITEPKRKIPPYHPAGIIQIDGEDILPPDYNTGIYQQYTPEQVRQRTPQYNTIPFNRDTKNH